MEGSDFRVKFVLEVIAVVRIVECSLSVGMAGAMVVGRDAENVIETGGQTELVVLVAPHEKQQVVCAG